MMKASDLAENRMKEYPHQIGLLEPPASRRPREIATWLGLLLVLVCPWPLGSAQAISEFILYLSLAAIAALWAWSVTSANEPVLRFPLAGLPVLLGVMLGLFQATTMPVGLVESLSVLAGDLWRDLAASEIAFFGKTEVSATISLYPESTRQTVARLIAGGVAFLLGCGLFSRPLALRRLFITIAITGTGLAVFGIVQQLTWNGRLFWVLELPRLRDPFASFLNHNHAANMLTMGLGTSLALAMVSRDQRAGWRNRDRLWLIPAAVCLLAILMTLSRSGFVAVTAALAVCVIVSVMFARQWRGIIPILLVGVLAVVSLGWLGVSDAVESRLASILDVNPDTNPRLLHWRDMRAAVPWFGRMGSGLGTYRFVSPYFEAHETEEWYYHADNQYLETLIETGFPGLSLLMLTLAISTVTIVRGIELSRGLATYSYLLGGLFLLVAQAVHAMFDFAILVPANFVIFGVALGAVLSHSLELLRERGQGQWQWLSLPDVSGSTPVLVVSAVIILEMYYPISFAFAAHQATAMRKQVDQQIGADFETAEQLEARAISFDSFLEHAPASVELEWRAAAIWIEVFRRKQPPGEFPDPYSRRDEDHDWPTSTTSTAAYLKMCRWWRTGQHRELESFREDPQVQICLGTAIEHCLRARRACPLEPWAHFRLGELAFLNQSPDLPNPFLVPLRRLGQFRPEYAYAAGMLAIASGNIDDAMRCWKVAIRRSDENLTAALNAAREAGVPATDVARDLFPDSPVRLVQIAQSLGEDGELQEFRAAAVERAKELLKQSSLDEAEVYFLRGSLESLSGRHRQATEDLDRAVLLRPGRADWRYQLVLNHIATGNIDEARKELKLCIQLDRGNSEYRQLNRDLYRRQNNQSAD